MIKVATTLFVITYGLFSFCYSKVADSKTQVDQRVSISGKTCFRKPFSSYDDWLAMISKGAAKRFKNEHKQQASIAKFKHRFPQQSFEKYRQSMICETMLYASGKGKVSGFVIKPKHIDDKLPVVVYNRGGNGAYGRVNMAYMMSSLLPLAEHGFIVIGSQYRGYSKNPDPDFDDEFGGADVEYILSLTRLIPSIDGADASRIGVLGASRGAMQSYIALRAGLKAKALVTIAGNTDLKAGLSFRPEMENVYKQRIPHYATQGSEQLKERSALYWIDELEASMPILLLHGEEDKRVASFHSVNMADKLKALHRPHKLVLYRGDDHSLNQNRDAALQIVIDWFKQHL